MVEENQENKTEKETTEPEKESEKETKSEPEKESADKSEVISVKIKKENVWKYSTFLLLAILILGGVLVYTGKLGTTGNIIAPTPTPNPTPTPSAPTPTPSVEASIDDDAILGDKNAPVTIIEFSDYECPFCARFYSETLPSIKSEYIDKGLVRLVFRDYPLGFHPAAHISAQATECVREQGGDEAFWQIHDTIFENQASLNEANLLAWATEMGYDIKECLDTEKYKAEVDRDMADGIAAGVQGTPGFIVNGIPISGAQPFSAFKQVIDAELEA